MSPMHWSSWQDFVAMGGYGLYVWGSLGMVLAVLVFEQINLALRRRAAIRVLRAPADPAWRDTAPPEDKA